MKHIVDGFIHAKRRAFYEEGEGDYEYTWWGHADMSSCNYIMVCPHQLTIEVPDDFNPIPIEIANYRKEQQRIRAEAQSKVNLLEEQIGKLLALELKKEAA